LAGVNPNGGFGKVKNIILAICILQALSSGFNIYPSINNFIRNLIWGTVLVSVMCINHIREQSQLKKGKKERAKSVMST